MSLELTHSEMVCRLIVGRNKVRHGLSLAQIHLTIEISPSCVFSGLSHAASVVDEQLQDGVGDILTAVATDFSAFLAGIAIGGMEDANEHIVKGIALRVFDFAIMQCIGLCRSQRLMTFGCEDIIDQSQTAFTADTNDGNGTSSTGSRSTNNRHFISSLKLSE